MMSECLDGGHFIYGVFTVQRNKSANPYKKVTVRKIISKGSEVLHVEKFTETQAYHENIGFIDGAARMADMIKNEYRNANIFADDCDYQFLISKKGSIKIVEKPPTMEKSAESHDRKKEYLIREGEPCDFLVHLGVMSLEGHVYAKKYDKFRQINKFLEIVDDALSRENLREGYKIVDFGCGKAYLTFALYYYFRSIRHIPVMITGLDIKADVIEFCNKTASELNYEGLSFEIGDIKDYDADGVKDMVVTLHACDNATDAALVKAVEWGTSVILSVPCCQHELYSKIDNACLEPMLKHGLIRERMSSLVTDSLRCLFLETKGYKVQLTEFIALEHTPKNILIKAVKTGKVRDGACAEYDDFKKFWGLDDLFIEEYYNSLLNERRKN